MRKLIILFLLIPSICYAASMSGIGDMRKSVYDSDKDGVVEYADTVTNATLTTALTVNTGTLTLTADVGNDSVLTIGGGAVSVSGSNTGDDDVPDAGDFGAGTDLDANGAVAWGNLAEGELTDSTIVSADIKDGEVTEADLNVSNAPGAGEDNYVLTYNHAATNFTWAADADSGSPTLDAIQDPAGATTLSCADTENITITTAQNTAGSFLRIDNTVADVTGNVYLLDLDYSVDDDQANADFIKCQDAGGVVFSVQETGIVAATGTITAVGSFIIGAADMAEADLEKLDGITNGTAAASKALVLDASSDIATINSLTATTLVGALTGNASSATVGTTVTITDNEATAENNPIVFVAGADPDGGNLGLETDGTAYYTPSTGIITTTGFAGALTGNATTVTNATLTTALTVNTGTLTLTADVANNSVLTLGAGASSISGANTGDNTVATTGDSATDFFDAGEIVDARISDTLTSSTCTGNASTVTTNANLTGEVTSVGNAATIADTVTVTGWVLGTSSATQITSPTVITDLLDTTGAADMDYGSIDVLDHTFTTNDCTLIIDGGITVSTGDTITLGATAWNSADNIDGEVIADNTIDVDSLDWGAFTDLGESGAVVWGNLGAGELTDDSVNDDDINWADISNLAANGACTLSATVTVADDEATDDDQEIVFTTDNATLESDGDFHYSPDTGTVTATEFAGGGSGLTGVATTASLNPLKDNILMNAFRIAINGSLVKFNMIDGIMDEFEDESGVDTGTSTYEDYDSANDLYSPTSIYLSNADIDDEDMADISDWADDDTGNGVSSQATFDVKSCMKLLTGVGNGYAWRTQDIGTFGARTVFSFSAYCDATGATVDDDEFIFRASNGTSTLIAFFGTDGLTVHTGSGEAGTDIVQQDTWQEWTLDVTWASQSVDVYLDKVFQATITWDYTASPPANGEVKFLVAGYTTDNRLAYVDWFKAGSDFSGVNNMTLVSESTEAEANPDNIRMFIVQEDVDACTVNTDITGEVSRDSGANWVAVTLVDEGDIESSMRILSGTGDVSGQAADKTIKWRVKTLNNKDQDINAIGLIWD